MKETPYQLENMSSDFEFSALPKGAMLKIPSAIEAAREGVSDLDAALLGTEYGALYVVTSVAKEFTWRTRTNVENTAWNYVFHRATTMNKDLLA